MNRRYLFLSLIVLLVTSVDLAVVLPMPILGHSLSLTFISASLLAFLLPSSTSALQWGMIQGLITDFYSPAPFGSYIVSCFLLVILIKFLQYTWFKQSSALSVAMIEGISLVFVYAVFILYGYLAYILNWSMFNPTPNTYFYLISGIAMQCIIINVIIRLITGRRKFVLV